MTTSPTQTRVSLHLLPTLPPTPTWSILSRRCASEPPPGSPPNIPSLSLTLYSLPVILVLLTRGVIAQNPAHIFMGIIEDGMLMPSDSLYSSSRVSKVEEPGDEGGKRADKSSGKLLVDRN